MSVSKRTPDRTKIGAFQVITVTNPILFKMVPTDKQTTTKFQIVKYTLHYNPLLKSK